MKTSTRALSIIGGIGLIDAAFRFWGHHLNPVDYVVGPVVFLIAGAGLILDAIFPDATKAPASPSASTSKV